VHSIKIKSYCKINLSLKILKKISGGYHSIASLITFCDLHDIISISRINKLKDEISFSGKFQKGINKRSNTITKVLNLLRNTKLLKNKTFKINIQKNIPHGSGLGGGSSNAAYLLNYFNSRLRLKLSKNKINKIANQIGFDTPINLKKKNTFLTGKKGEIIRLKKNFKLNIVIVYPNFICSTGEIYRKNTVNNLSKPQPIPYIKNNKKLIDYLKNEKNDLEKTVIKIFPKVKEVINYIKSQKGCCFSRITGSGSACIGIFSSKNNAIYAQKLIKLKYPNYWCVVSKTI
jgi:4-diphosphocytidyl-2-C-methyl-D-erythritol kinase|tara:strand:- start:60 stop:923 length:864 start_codon:yes stop_codon:yes gene_type:complete